MRHARPAQEAAAGGADDRQLSNRDRHGWRVCAKLGDPSGKTLAQDPRPLAQSDARSADRGKGEPAQQSAESQVQRDEYALK
jgi:hypothetical protein